MGVGGTAGGDDDDDTRSWDEVEVKWENFLRGVVMAEGRGRRRKKEEGLGLGWERRGCCCEKCDEKWGEEKREELSARAQGVKELRVILLDQATSSFV